MWLRPVNRCYRRHPCITVGILAAFGFRDTGVTFTERDQRALFSALVAAAGAGSAVGVAVIMAIYLSPEFPSALPDHNLVKSWELDFDALGYTRQEAMDRINLWLP